MALWPRNFFVKPAFSSTFRTFPRNIGIPSNVSVTVPDLVALSELLALPLLMVSPCHTLSQNQELVALTALPLSIPLMPVMPLIPNFETLYGK